MKLFFQTSLAALIFGALALVFHMGWADKAAIAPAAARSVWQQGLWPLQDQLARTVRKRALATRRPFRAAIRVDTSAMENLRFSAFNTDAFIRALETATADDSNITFLPDDSRETPDMSVIISLTDYNAGTTTDTIAGTMTFIQSDSEQTETPFQASCPAHGRDWFVQSAYPPNRMLIGATILIAIGAITGLLGAADAFKGDYPGSRRMLGAIPALGLSAYLLLAFVSDPGHGEIGIPRLRVRVALDTSDAVRFPPTPTAALPVPASNPDEAEYNDLCAFIELCMIRIEDAMQLKTRAETPGGFITWLHKLTMKMGQPQRQSDMLSISDGLEIAHKFPVDPEPHTKTAPAFTEFTDLHSLLAAGHRGNAPGFFLPWSGSDKNRANEMVVAFMTAEPASFRQAMWLRENRDSLRELRPAAVQTLGILLPAIARSESEEWKPPARLLNIAAVSDKVITLGESGYAETAKIVAQDIEIEDMPVFRHADGGDVGTESDLDDLRSKLFQAESGDMHRAAARIAQQVYGMADVRRADVFQTPHAGLLPAIIMAACLALFFGLQRELRLLGKNSCTFGRLEKTGALLCLAAGLTIALIFGYATAEPARWRTANEPLTVLWAITVIWFAGVWLPMLLGRSPGELPRPTSEPKVSRIYRWYALSMAGLLPMIAAAYFKRYAPEAAIAAFPTAFFNNWIVAPTVIPFAMLAITYARICFYRESRRAVLWTGGFCLAALCALPWMGPWILEKIPESEPNAGIIVLLLTAVLITLPTLPAWFSTGKTRPLERTADMGWSVTPGFLGACALSIILFRPAPMSRGVAWLDIANDNLPVAITACILIWFIAWLIDGVLREVKR